MKLLMRLFITFCALFSTELFAGSLKVNLTPSAAVSAGAQWRVDGGSWKNSGVTVNNLSNGTHSVSYKTVTGWITPATATVTITNSTTTLNTTYVQAASLKINLTPTTGQWRVDGGTWRTSGTTVSGLTPGSHSIEYAAISGYSSPATENISLVSGQTTTLARSYIQLSSLRITLTPTTGQWRIDGGTWRTSGTTVSGLTPGSHSIEYAAISGYSSPATENISLVSGQTTTLARSYIQLSSLRITLTPTTGQWRVDGGTWQTSGTTLANLTPGAHTVDYAALAGYTAPTSESVTLTSGQTLSINRSYIQLALVKVTLTPSTAQWNIDGGAWQASGATVGNLALGAHTINYSSLSNYSSPASESITLTVGQTLTLSRSYIQLAQVSITLTPTTGQWRANGGAWQPTGAFLSVLPGSYLIEYSALADYDSPANESITLAAGGNFTATRTYTTTKPSLQINLTPATGQWRVDGGAWQSSGALVTGLTAGSHSIDYTDMGGTYNPLPAETVSLVLRQNAVLSRSYPIKPPAALTITLDPANAQWRVDGGVWQTNGATIGNLAYNIAHTIDYSPVSGYATPSSETFTPTSGQLVSLTRSYTQLAEVSFTLTPTTGQWNIDGGPWQTSGATVSNLSPGSHTVNYLPLTGYASPQEMEFGLNSGDSLTFTSEYIPLAHVSINLQPNTGQWRVDDSDWQSSGATLDVAPGTLWIEYASLEEYDAPTSEQVVFTPGETLTIDRNYISIRPTLRINLTTAISWHIGGQWRVDGGAWQSRNLTSVQLPAGTHTIEYLDIGDPFIPPPTETITLALRENITLTRSYSLKPRAALSVTLDPANAQWRVDGGTWQASGVTVSGLIYNSPLTIEYAPVAGYSAPVSETVTIASGQTLTLARSYVLLPQLSITLTPTTGEWSIDGGPSQISGATVIGLSPGMHTISYKPLNNYASPATETVNLTTGQSLNLSRSYTQLASFYIDLTPASAQWRIDGGSWISSGPANALSGLSLGTHTIEYSNVFGYITPAPETVTLISGTNPSITRAYTQLATFGVVLTPSSAQWRPQGGTTWIPSGTIFTDAPLGTSMVEFSDIPGYITPAPVTVNLVSGSNPTLNVSYVQLANFSVTLTPASAQWRVIGSLGTSNWWASGFVLPNLPLETFTVEFSDVYGYITPSSTTITLASGPNSLSRAYTEAASLTMTLSPASLARWRIDGGQWTNAFTLPNLVPGTHTIDYDAISGYIAPASETVNLVSGPNSLTRSYSQLAYFQVELTPTSGQIRVDGGNWINSGNFAAFLALGSHSIEYAPVAGYITPPTETITLTSGLNPPLVRSYTQEAYFQVELTPTSGQIRVDGGNWIYSGNFAAFLALGSHSVEYAPVAGYITPPTETITLTSGLNPPLVRSYTPEQPAFTIVKNFEDFGSSPTMFVSPDGFIYGVTGSGGNRGAGQVFKMNPDGSGVQILHSFPSGTGDGLSPNALIEDTNGTLYGTTGNGGVGTNNGTLFRVNKDGSGYMLLRSFTALSEGSSPNSIIQGSDGALYGTTLFGGASLNGLIFRVNSDGTNYSVIKSINSSEGSNLKGLIEGPSGMLYGVGTSGGSSNLGTVFRMNFNGTGFTVLKSFGGGADGSGPVGTLLYGSDGLIYGTTANGGSAGNGLIYRLTPDGTGYQGLHHFLGGTTDGMRPQTGLTEGPSSLLYGTTNLGGGSNKGVLFRINKDGSGFNLLLNPSGGANDGGNPGHKILLASNGILFCVNKSGGTGASGLIFKLNQDGTGFTPLKQLGAPEGSTPQSSVTVASDSVIYGTTYNGGLTTKGNIFKINLDGTGYTVLHHFGISTDGANPIGKPIEGSDGLIYGTTVGGSPYGRGSVYRINKDGTGYTLLHQFSPFGGDGRYPRDLVEASDGLLYGTTDLGGIGERGILYRMTKDGSNYIILQSFLNANNNQAAYTPRGIVVEGNDGRLYGTASAGGVLGGGTVYVINKNGTGYSVLRNFAGGPSDGSSPKAALLKASDGMLYSTTEGGGAAGLGTIYKLKPDGTGYVVLKQFSGGTTDGANPTASGLIENNGVIYGVTTSGGTFNSGVIYSINFDGSGYQVLINFGAGETDGTLPQGLALTLDGIIFGTTNFGGAGGGTIFRFQP